VTTQLQAAQTVNNKPSYKYPSDGWADDLSRMPSFTRAEVRAHISQSGKNIDPKSKNHSVPTSMRKATTFLNDEYLKDIKACSDSHYFYFKCQCFHSYRKNDKPHDLKFTMCLESGQVLHAFCSCVAGRVGFCNHVLALMMKVCLFSVYEVKNVKDFNQDDDLQPKKSCTSTLQQWHRKGRGKKITPQPVMDVFVTKTSLDTNKISRREPGVGCLLYEARKSTKSQGTDESVLLEKLRKINPNMALSQIMTPRFETSFMIQTKMGRSPQGSFASYQLSLTEHNFTVYCDIASISRREQTDEILLDSFPRLPLRTTDNFQPPTDVSAEEQLLLQNITVSVDELNKIELTTRGQSNSDEWKKQRRFRITASNFNRTKIRKRQHDSLVKEFLEAKSFTSKYTNHGLEYESTALEQYQKYMATTGKPVKVCKSGLVVCLDAPYLGASPDGKVIDVGCTDPFGLVEIKCPQTMFLVTPLDACSHENFCLENVNGQPKLKHNHCYYTQVQGQMGVTGARWCDFVVYTSKGLSIERVPFDLNFWLSLKESLRSFYFKYFLPFAAKNN